MKYEQVLKISFIYLQLLSCLYTGPCQFQLNRLFLSRSSPFRPSWYSPYVIESYYLVFLETFYSKQQPAHHGLFREDLLTAPRQK